MNTYYPTKNRSNRRKHGFVFTSRISLQGYSIHWGDWLERLLAWIMAHQENLEDLESTWQESLQVRHRVLLTYPIHAHTSLGLTSTFTRACTLHQQDSAWFYSRTFEWNPPLGSLKSSLPSNSRDLHQVPIHSFFSFLASIIAIRNTISSQGTHVIRSGWESSSFPLKQASKRLFGLSHTYHISHH